MHRTTIVWRLCFQICAKSVPTTFRRKHKTGPKRYKAKQAKGNKGGSFFLNPSFSANFLSHPFRDSDPALLRFLRFQGAGLVLASAVTTVLGAGAASAWSFSGADDALHAFDFLRLTQGITQKVRTNTFNSQL